MHDLRWMLTVLSLHRRYAVFIAAKVLALGPTAGSPAHAREDGASFHPSQRFVRFGHCPPRSRVAETATTGHVNRVSIEGWLVSVVTMLGASTRRWLSMSAVRAVGMLSA